ncbi:MAG: FAD-dependent oxidoreductase, partial [Rhizobacter sp.]|nr:FAD-dependent oxidoreductase [Rhizobacter sp.]
LVLEAETAVGTGISARNSEVIHAGLYYPAESLKARLCVQGRHRLYAYCDLAGIEHRRCGKLVVAVSPEQEPALQQLLRQAAANGVDDLRWLSAAEARVLEPALRCTAAVLSPSTGIIDSHALMLSLQGDLERAGGAVALDAPVVGIDCASPLHTLQVGGASPMQLQARIVVNSAGLWAPRLASKIRVADPALSMAGRLPTAYFAKGNYYGLVGRSPFSRLVYPVPESAGLGVHLTLDLGGQARFGPDVEWIDPADDGAIDYAVDPARSAGFYAKIRQYWPDLPDDALAPGYSGVRPKIHAPGEPAGDFMLHGPRAHGVNGLMNLFGIESPGLTASLALADEVIRQLRL